MILPEKPSLNSSGKVVEVNETKRDVFRPDPIDEKLKTLVKIYEDEIGRCTPTIYEELKDIVGFYPEDWFSMACKEAAKMNKRNFNYVMGILKRWHTDGISDSKQTKPRERDVEVES